MTPPLNQTGDFLVTLLFALLLIVASSGPTSVAFADVDVPERSYADHVIEQADRQRLSHARYWHLLVHYKQTVFGTYESEEDGPGFFASPTGKTDPDAELVATLRGFFTPTDQITPGEEHPQCVFPARYKWLKAQLSFDPSRLPEQRCDRLAAWLTDLNSDQITLVFAAYYMNNPASMFGHTFLRIDKKHSGPQQQLLAYGVNYAADPDTLNPLMYTLKGLFGAFKGRFSLFPYYVKVQEYSNLESRDLWEYALHLNEEQTQYLLLHLWELGGNYFHYYYFQENCSYHILSLLEVADPALHLTDQFRFQVIPADTVKAVTTQPGLVSKRIYRPSLLSLMDHKRLRMSRAQRALLYRLIKDPGIIHDDAYRTMSVPEQALVLDAYLDYAQYQNMQKERTATAIDATTRSLLLERSRLDYRGEEASDIAPLSTPPELGHDSARIAVGVGADENESFHELSIRPAYHDLLAQDTGYSRGSQILFLDFTARYYRETQTLQLHRFRLIDIVSFTPHEPLLKKKSWRLAIGVDPIEDLDCRYCSAFTGQYGIGASHQSDGYLSVLAYALINFDLELSSRFDPRYRLGAGPTIGLLVNPTDQWRIQLAAEYRSFPAGNRSRFTRASLNQRYAVGRNVDLRASVSSVNDRWEWLLAANWYF
ncbi:MAG: DUF4105 domain-containing protein [Nitrospirota bacterium]